MLVHRFLAERSPELEVELTAWLAQQAALHNVALERALDLVLALYKQLLPFLVIYGLFSCLSGGAEKSGRAEEPRAEAPEGAGGEKGLALSPAKPVRRAHSETPNGKAGERPLPRRRTIAI